MAEHPDVFDLSLRDQNIPPNVPARPVGTTDELEALGLDLAVYPSCAKPNKAAGIRGCDEFHRCPLSCKGKTFAEGGGPRRYGWERLFKGKPVRRLQGDCWSVARDAEFVEDNRGVIRIIAEEGETFEKKVGAPVKTFVNDKGEVVKVVAKDGEEHLPNVKREDIVVNILVTPFKRPHENVDIATDVITADVVRKEHERIQREAIPAALGIEGAGSPLDQRNKRGGKGKGEGPKSSAVGSGPSAGGGG